MYELIDGKIPVFGDVDEGARAQIISSVNSPYAYRGAICADGHRGYCSMPVGGVVAYHDAISPSGVGHDVACGNKAVMLDIPSKEVKAKIQKLAKDIYKTIPFGIGTPAVASVDDHPIFDDPAWNHKWLNPIKEMGRKQLGSVGSGNHYVDIFEDENERIWIGVHFGSRGVGFKIADYFFDQVGAKDGVDTEPIVLSLQSAIGQDYLEAMQLAGKFAYAGRDLVCQIIAKNILGAKIVEEVHNHHNFAWKETHFGEEYWVVRKGSTPNAPGQLSFVGGSMGDFSYIFRGKDSELAKLTLYSTVHGAGRVLGRNQARGKFKMKTNPVTGKKEKRIISEGCVSPEMMKDWLAKMGTVLVGGGTDESPHCYKRIDEVMQHHEGTIDVVHKLKPLAVCMAGEEIFDPFKD